MSETDQGRLPAERQARLIEFIAQVGHADVKTLAKRCQVSVDTIRRDLDQLDRIGAVVRTHGGAMSPEAAPVPDLAVQTRMRLNVKEKDLIGALAAQLVADRSILMINGGSTVLAVARHLRGRSDLTIATNNLLLAAELPAQALRSLYVFGGGVRMPTLTTTGPVRFVGSYASPDLNPHADLALIAVGGVAASGCFTNEVSEAAMMADMMRSSHRVAVLADASKFNRTLFARASTWAEVDFLVTDQAPVGPFADALIEHEVDVITPGWSGPR